MFINSLSIGLAIVFLSLSIGLSYLFLESVKLKVREMRGKKYDN